MSQPGTDLVGRKVRLTGESWDGMNRVRRGAVRTVKTHSIPFENHTESVSLVGGYMGFLRKASGFAVQPLPPRERIHVLVWGVPESSSGFDWVPADRDPGGAENLRRLFNLNVIDDDFEGYVVLAELHVAGYAPDDAGRQRVTDYIEGELQDAIGAGLVGKIIDRY